jgi:hypothetical protein
VLHIDDDDDDAMAELLFGSSSSSASSVTTDASVVADETPAAAVAATGAAASAADGAAAHDVWVCAVARDNGRLEIYTIASDNLDWTLLFWYVMDRPFEHIFLCSVSMVFVCAQLG